MLSNNADIISGVSIIPLPGHTPGHAGFRVDDGNESMFHMGDIIHVPKLQLKDPNICTLFDVDAESALEHFQRQHRIECRYLGLSTEALAHELCHPYGTYFHFHRQL